MGHKKNKEKPVVAQKSENPIQRHIEPLFPNFWKKSKINSGIQKGKVITGSFRINANECREAFVTHPKNDADIYIPGSFRRNRALNSDMVYVKIEPIRNWRLCLDNLDWKFKNWVKSKHESNGANDFYYFSVGDFLTWCPNAFDANCGDFGVLLRKNLDTYVPPWDDSKTYIKDLCWWQVIQRVGRVVGIKARANKRIAIGRLAPVNISNNEWDFACLKPYDSRLPNVHIHRSTLPKACSAETIGVQSIYTRKKMRSSLSDQFRVYGFFIPTTGCSVFQKPTEGLFKTRMFRLKLHSDLNFAFLAPTEIASDPGKYRTTDFIVKITDWPIDSLSARGELIRQYDLSSKSVIEDVTNRILINAGFPYGLEQSMTFPPEVEHYVAQNLLPSITPEVLAKEMSLRRDFRSHCVFTIDPSTARDLDDALHVRRLSPEEVAQERFKDVVYEVGVHIADVSYYVRPEDPVDKEASLRTTSIYLVQCCVPMLPRQLCEDLCSLCPGSDKLTFSVVFKLTSKGEIKSSWMGRSVINSRAQLTYEEAQCFIDEPERDWQPSDLKKLMDGADVKEICKCVNLLNELAVQIRARRFQKGGLQINQVKPIFSLSPESGDPTSVDPFIAQDSNRLIEEFMLAANESVASVLVQNLPQTALLRRHPPPTSKQLRDLQKGLSDKEIQLDVSSAHNIQLSLNELAHVESGKTWQYASDLKDLCKFAASLPRIQGTVEKKVAGSEQEADALLDFEVSEQRRVDALKKEGAMLGILTQLSKCMHLAEYYCEGEPNGSHRGHYCLNMPHYTHFTSPIRRYPDLIVHRQLAQILAKKAHGRGYDTIEAGYRSTSTSKMLQSPREIEIIADRCNANKLDARKANEASIELFFTVYVKEHGPIVEPCVILNIWPLNRSMDVLIISSGLIRPVNLSDTEHFLYYFERTLVENADEVVEEHICWRKAKIDKDGPGYQNCSCFVKKIRPLDIVRCVFYVKKDIDFNNSIVDFAKKMEGLVLRPKCPKCENYLTIGYERRKDVKKGDEEEESDDEEEEG